MEVLTRRTVAESRAFTRRAPELLSEQARTDLIDLLARDPLAGDMIPGTGGLRKLRWAADAKGQGTRSGARVIYYVLTEDHPIYLMAIYGKGERADLTPDGKQAMAGAAAAIREEAASMPRKRR